MQISIQDTDAANADRIAHYQGGHAKKLEVAGWVRALGLPLTLNAPDPPPEHRQPAGVHRSWPSALGAQRLEVAHVQYYGWALKNRQALMPTREQVLGSAEVVAQARERLKGILVIDFVVPDYYARRPKPCMGGWGRGIINITPSGKVLPCHAAESLPGLEFDNVRDKKLRDIWLGSQAFQKYRGTEWMQEPCRSCEFREQDWGGCRCQAFAIAGDADARRSGLPQIRSSPGVRRHRRARGRGRSTRLHLPQSARRSAIEAAGTAGRRSRILSLAHQTNRRALHTISQDLSGDAHMRSAGISAAKLAAGIGLAALLAISLASGLACPAAPRPTSGPGANPLDTSEQLLAKTKQDKGLKPHATPLTVTPLEKIPLAKIKVPAGFKVEVWAHGMPGARMMTRGDKGTIFVGTRAIGKVYAITDKGSERTHKVIPEGQQQPNGLAFAKGTLFVITIDKSLPPRRHRGQARQSPQVTDVSDKLNMPASDAPQLEVLRHRPRRQALYGHRLALQRVRDQHRHAWPDPPPEPRRLQHRGRGPRRAQLGRLRLAPADQGALVHRQRSATGSATTVPRRSSIALPRATRAPTSASPTATPTALPDPTVKRPNPCAGVTLPAATLGPHAAALGMRFYYGQHVPGDLQEHRLHRPARLVEPRAEVRL